MLKNKNKMRSSRVRNLNTNTAGYSLIFNIKFPPQPPPCLIQNPPPAPWDTTTGSSDFSNIINQSDSFSTFNKLEYAGQFLLEMYNRRTDDRRYYNAYLFNAFYTLDNNNNWKIEIQVNPEFSQDMAHNYALQYATIIGKLPKALLISLETVSIHDGEYSFGGLNKNIIIHVGEGKKFNYKGCLEELIIHEACHTSLDYYAYNNNNWIDAQKKDNAYISTYAGRECGGREDIAESFLAYFAVTYRKDRISDNTYKKITSTIPNRINFFDSLNLDMFPYKKSPQT
jgi:hypothetical protein